MNGNPLSPTDRVTAALCFYFQAGIDARAALSDGARSVSVPSPTVADLAAIADNTPIARWKSIEPVAEALIADAVANTDRNITDVAHDVVNSVRKVQSAFEKLTGGKMRDIRDLATMVAEQRKPRSGK